MIVRSQISIISFDDRKNVVKSTIFENDRTFVVNSSKKNSIQLVQSATPYIFEMQNVFYEYITI